MHPLIERRDLMALAGLSTLSLDWASVARTGRAPRGLLLMRPGDHRRLLVPGRVA